MGIYLVVLAFCFEIFTSYRVIMLLVHTMKLKSSP